MKPPLRLVLDTNVVLSALLWEGRPAELLDLGATDGVRLFTSQTLLAELERSLSKPMLSKRNPTTSGKGILQYLRPAEKFGRSNRFFSPHNLPEIRPVANNSL